MLPRILVKFPNGTVVDTYGDICIHLDRCNMLHHYFRYGFIILSMTLFFALISIVFVHPKKNKMLDIYAYIATIILFGFMIMMSIFYEFECGLWRNGKKD
jgi:cytochrome c oxidase subunit IV